MKLNKIYFSYDTNTVSQTDTTLSDDEDDELLALRIAALESIKLQKSKAAAAKQSSKKTEEEKPDFVIKPHANRSNLLSIVTCEDEKEVATDKKESSSPPLIPYFDPTRPPPGFNRGSAGRISPFSRRSRSPRRYGSRSRSRSPGRRWSRSPPPHYRRRSVSPFRRRRSFSRSPERRRSPLRRSRSPVKERSPSVSEWETDTETEEEEEKEETKEETPKAEDKAEAKPEEKEKPEKKDVSNDDDGDDVLKLDASAEEDEFSAFLNEFEDEVLSKKEDKKDGVKKEKKERPPYEKKVVDGKKLRKKIKPKKATPPPKDRRSPSPRLARSPGSRYFSPSRQRDGKFQDRSSQDRQRIGKSRERERSSKSKEKTLKESKPVETAAEREERERREREERLAKLPTPEREMMEARRKKFEKKIDGSKKISLKSVKTEEDVNFGIKKRGDRDSVDRRGDRDSVDRLKDEDPAPVRRNVTDLRVQLHKKKKAQEPVKAGGRLAKSTSPVSPGQDAKDLEDEAYGPVETTGRRKVVAPGKRIVRGKLEHSEEESDRSPSPPAKLLTRKRKSSGEDNLKGRRILMVRKDRNSSPEEDFTITKKVSPSKGIK